MSRLTNNNGIPNKCVGCAEISNCFGHMSCPEICHGLNKLKHYESKSKGKPDWCPINELPNNISTSIAL